MLQYLRREEYFMYVEAGRWNRPTMLNRCVPRSGTCGRRMYDSSQSTSKGSKYLTSVFDLYDILIINR